MNDLHKAIGDISSIRRQMARSTEFRGYGPTTLAGTGVFAVLAAGMQAVRLRDPANHISAYLGIWILTAVLSAALIGTQMHARTRRIHSGLADEMIRMAVVTRSFLSLRQKSGAFGFLGRIRLVAGRLSFQQEPTVQFRHALPL